VLASEAAPTGDGTGVADGGTASLEPAAVLATLLGGIAGSAAHLPTSAPVTAATRVPAPPLG
jgi:hypothetical protein